MTRAFSTMKSSFHYNEIFTPQDENSITRKKFILLCDEIPISTSISCNFLVVNLIKNSVERCILSIIFRALNVQVLRGGRRKAKDISILLPGAANDGTFYNSVKL